MCCGQRRSLLSYVCQNRDLKPHRCWDFHIPQSSTFMTNPPRVKQMLRRSKWTQRVTEAASAVRGITFHHSKWYGWGLTTVTMTLLLYTTLSSLARGRGWTILPTFTVSCGHRQNITDDVARHVSISVASLTMFVFEGKCTLYCSVSLFTDARLTEN